MPTTASTVFVRDEPGRSTFSRPQGATCQMSSTSSGSPTGGRSADSVQNDTNWGATAASVGMMSTPSRAQSQM